MKAKPARRRLRRGPALHGGRLRRAKARADAARRAAEAEARAVTRLLAAASHDLRQPLHALGLFAEALRERVAEPEAAALVDSVARSVEALDGLFAALLDLTRLDAGGVATRPAPFALGELYGRLRLHFEPTAFEKGLALRFRGGARAAHADPLLVERILRNLLANAIRYTEDGGVLVAARCRGGRLLLQVWDSGPGIAPEEQARIFEAFYRGGAADGEARGHGLGLAVVRRLVALLDAPLSLRSLPGRGSVFSLELPMAEVPAQSAAAASAPAGAWLARRRVLVLEDEPAVRRGLDALLRSWGAEVLAFDGAAACAGWAHDAGAARPDVLLLDQRLDGGPGGGDMLALLRARFGAGLPALVVTGDSAASAAQAAALGAGLLVKPVLPNRLRQALAQALGLR